MDQSVNNHKQLRAKLAALQAEKDTLEQEAAALRDEVTALRDASAPQVEAPHGTALITKFENRSADFSTPSFPLLGLQAERDQLLQDFRAMLNSLLEGVISLDTEGKLAFSNASARKMLGWRGFERTGQLVHDRIHPPRSDGVVCTGGTCSILTALVSDDAIGEEDVYFRNDGSSFPVKYTISPWRVRQKRMGAIITFRDVTQQKQAEAQLEALQASFRATFEQPAVGIAHVNMNGTVRRANRFLAEMLGYLPEALVGLPSSELAHPDDYAVAVDRVRRLLLRESDSYPYETRMITRDGRILWTNVTGSLIRTAAGKPDYLLVVIERIDQRKELQQELVAREREATQQAAEVLAVLDAIPHPVVVISMQGQVVRTNARMQEYLAYLGIEGDAQTLVERAIAELSVRSVDEAPLDMSKRPLWRILSGEVISPDNAIEIHVAERSGVERYVSVTGAPVRNAAGEVIEAVCIFNDVTGRRRLERELADRVSQLEATFEAMTDGVLVVDADGTVLRANTAYRNLFASADLPAQAAAHNSAPHVFEVGLHDALGRVLPRDETPIVRTLLGDVLRGRDAMDLLLIADDGSEIPIIVSGSPVRDASGAIIGAVCIYRDVRERRIDLIQTRDLLYELLEIAVAGALPMLEGRGLSPTHERALVALVLAARICDIVLRKLGCQRVGITAVDPLSEAVIPIGSSGMTPEYEREWREDAARSSLADYFDAAARMRLRRGEVVVHDARGEMPEGEMSEQEHRRILAAPVQADGTLVGILGCEQVGSTREYTPGDLALVRAAAQVAALVIQSGRPLQLPVASGGEVATRSDPSLNALLSAIVRAFEQPLSRLREGQGLLPRTQAEHAKQVKGAKAARIEEAALRSLERQLDELRGLTAIRSGTLSLTRSRIDLSELLDREVRRQRRRHRLRRIVLIAEAGVFVDGDAVRLRWAFGALLDSATTATPPDVPVTMTVTHAGAYVRISVRDGGAPLTSADCEHFFDLFYQATAPSRWAAQQDGLGAALAICKVIVEAHGGAVEVESTGERSATFWVMLPLAKDDPR